MSNILNNMHLDQSMNEYKSQDENSRAYEKVEETKDYENDKSQMDFEEEE